MVVGFYLGSHEFPCATECRCSPVSANALLRSTQTYEFDMTVRHEHYVIEFEIPMQNFPVMKKAQGNTNLCGVESER